MFVSGKDDRFAWDKPRVSEALSAEQKQILQQRGVLTPEEIHRMASKTRDSVGADSAQAACHTDQTSDAAEAQKIQVDTQKPRGISTSARAEPAIFELSQSDRVLGPSTHSIFVHGRA